MVLYLEALNTLTEGPERESCLLALSPWLPEKSLINVIPNVMKEFCNILNHILIGSIDRFKNYLLDY